MASNEANRKMADLAKQMAAMNYDRIADPRLVAQQHLTEAVDSRFIATASSSQVTLGNPLPANGGGTTNTGDEGVDKAERRKTDKVQWRDLEVGDVLVHDHGRYTILSKKMTPSNYYEFAAKHETGDDILLSGDGAMIKGGGFRLAVAKDGHKVVKVGFDTVILPDEKKQAIQDAVNQVDHHALIFDDWGFDDVFEKGTAISLLFWGPPGTGKTLTAQAIADQYDYKLKVISTAEIETPEPGGAERNIKKAFAESKDKTVLLFDECDSLVSSRQHMGSILAAQVNALLTELEHFTGIVVFTTNRIETLDEAFDRRLSLKLEFEMPNADQRAKIWERMFPKKAPLAKDVDFKQLATVEIAGGHIKNTVLKAARAAANSGGPKEERKISQAVLVKALTEEVESSVAFQNSKAKEQLYGTPLVNRGATISRGRGRMGVQRG